ncbi:hypothetical protein ACFFVB_10935 [Formosa undariae]|uniref:DUF3805 domain-containing protein n=1 Tax=Formosa undariae TaxID=1325436 RepID=A0ABV5F2C3_9FLAO
MMSEVNKLKGSKEILYPKTAYKEESFQDFTARYNGFGKNLYEALKDENIELFEKLKFYQMVNEKEDSFAEYIHNGISFTIHLCFYSELIILSTNKQCIEIGSWEKNEIEKAVHFILKTLIK